MKLGIAARDLRVLALLLVLVLTAAVLVVTSWPQREDLQPVEAAESAPAAVAAPDSVRRVSASRRRVATHWAEAYFTTSSFDPIAARRARLARYSSEALIAEMRVDSGALALRGGGASEAEVVALQEQDGTPGQALVAIVERTTTTGDKKSTELVTVTLQLVEQNGTWLVEEVLVP